MGRGHRLLNYRPEINGLRALAVLPVMLFHAGYNTFQGGYLGVDIFFVISGYLITTIIMNDLSKGRFGVIDFYDRRARRLMPALFFVLICTIPMAWLWLPPIEMREFALSLITSVTSTSNIFFWAKNDYFGAAVEHKPLIHTWSLSVEQQFYLLYPFLMLVIWKLKRGTIFASIALLALASLGLAQWMVYAYPNAAFFFLPTRLWELLIGALCALVLLNNTPSKNKFHDLFGLIGLLLIAGSILSFDASSRVPGITGLVPAVGTCLIILYAHKGTFVQRLLSAKYLVGIGLISYSAYLWHQPIFIFLRRSEIVDLDSLYAYPIAILIVLGLAYFSWKFVETPFRNRTFFSVKKIFVFNAAFITLFSLLGAWGEHTKGFGKRVVQKTLNVEKVGDVEHDIILLGDSHAGHLMAGLQHYLDVSIENRSGPGCIPFYNVDRYDYRMEPGACLIKTNDALDKALAMNGPVNIILSTMGPVYLDGETFRGKDQKRVTGQVVQNIAHPDLTDHWDVFEKGMRDTLTKFAGQPDKNLIFMMDVPELGIDFGCATTNKEFILFGIQVKDLLKGADAESCKIPRTEFDERAGKYHQFVKTILQDYPHVKLHDPTDQFCDEEWCYGHNKEYGYIYRDVDHLSINGSILAVGKLTNHLK